VTSSLASLDRVSVDRRSIAGRRHAGSERRKETVPVAAERRQGERRKTQRRRQIDPTTCERDYTAEELEFMRAMDDYKRASGRMFPTCSEILEVIRALGYAKPVTAGQPAAIAGPSETPPGAASTVLPPSPDGAP
jgi:hypothetical protein